jgi:hypothetical protein
MARGNYSGPSLSCTAFGGEGKEDVAGTPPHPAQGPAKPLRTPAD